MKKIKSQTMSVKRKHMEKAWYIENYDRTTIQCSGKLQPKAPIFKKQVFGDYEQGRIFHVTKRG